MSYISVDADDQRLEEGPEGLQFKSFLGTDSNANANQARTSNSSRSPGVGNADRGYLQEQNNARNGSASFWTVEYYQCYFDVDTKQVLKRCYSTLLPTSSSYLSTHLIPSADLYGPFWTLTTLIFTLFLSSSLAQSISVYLSDPGTAEYDYNFQLLSIAVSIVYTYGLGFPVLLWLALRYIGVGEWSVVEAVAVWGYGQFVWVPVSILCVVPVVIVRWVLVGIAFGLSGYFLIRNVYPILASAETKATRLLIIIIVILHAALALTFKVLFFSYYVVKIGIDVTLPGSDIGSGNSTMTMATSTSMPAATITATERMVMVKYNLPGAFNSG